MQRTEVVLPGAALLALLALVAFLSTPGCTKAGEHDFTLLRLFEAGRCTLTGPDGERAAPSVVMVEVAGEARPALEVASGVVVACETQLPREPCWLDVDAARRDDAPAALSGAPLLLDVEMVAGAARAVLLHALPSPGTKPTALGWVHARIEVRDHLGESVRFEFRLEPSPETAAPSSPPRFALADPRLAPRVDASARPWNLVDWLAPGPSADDLARRDAAKQWPGFARLIAATPRDEVFTATPPRSVRSGATTANVRATGFELQLFGCESPEDDGELARRPCDRFARVDPLQPYSSDPADPAFRPLARLDPALRADRARALGERTIQIELARPRRAPLCVEITSGRGAAECDAALLRLQEFLAANELLERTILLVRTLPPAVVAPSRGFAVARVPRGWRERAPAELVERFDRCAPEFESR